MYAYVLIIIVTTTGANPGASIATVEFKTLAGCEDTAKAIRKAGQESWTMRTSANCVNRDE